MGLPFTVAHYIFAATLNIKTNSTLLLLFLGRHLCPSKSLKARPQPNVWKRTAAILASPIYLNTIIITTSIAVALLLRVGSVVRRASPPVLDKSIANLSSALKTSHYSPRTTHTAAKENQWKRQLLVCFNVVCLAGRSPAAVAPACVVVCLWWLSLT